MQSILHDHFYATKQSLICLLAACICCRTAWRDGFGQEPSGQEAAGSRTNREATHHGLNDGRRWMVAAKDRGGARRRHIPIEK